MQFPHLSASPICGFARNNVHCARCPTWQPGEHSDGVLCYSKPRGDAQERAFEESVTSSAELPELRRPTEEARSVHKATSVAEGGQRGAGWGQL